MKIWVHIYTDKGTCVIDWDGEKMSIITLDDIEIDNHNAEVAMDILKLVVRRRNDQVTTN